MQVQKHQTIQVKRILFFVGINKYFNNFKLLIIVEIYEIKYSLTEQELNEHFEDCLDVQIVNNATIQPVPPGETVTIDVFIVFGENGVFFMAVRAIGTYGAKVI